MLVGTPGALTVPVALGLHLWPGWKSYDQGEPLRPLDADQLVRAGETGAATLRQQARENVPLLEKILAHLIDHPRRKLSIVGYPASSAVAAAVILGLREIADPYLFQRFGHRWNWTFSTYELRNDPGLPDVVFFPQGREGTDHGLRTVVGPNTGSSLSESALSEAARLVRRFVGDDPRRSAPLPQDHSPWTAPIGVFLSYCRQDEGPVRELAADLRAARLPVWFDEEIETGQAWWDEILRQIRSAAVVVHALSDAALGSEPCRAEREYADRLGLPVVPVLVGDADLRSTRYGTRQLVDYRSPDRRLVARLVGDVLRMAGRRAPLPDPLPDPPEAPFGYLLRLADELGRPSLDEDAQLRLLHKLIGHLDTAKDPQVETSLRRLLQQLVERKDVLHSVARMAGRELGAPRA